MELWINIFFPSAELQKHFHVKRKTVLGIYSTCEVQSCTKRLGHFVFHVKKIAIQVIPSSPWTVLGFKVKHPFSNLAQIMGHIFVLEEGRNLVKAVFMIDISSSLQASTI